MRQVIVEYDPDGGEAVPDGRVEREFQNVMRHLNDCDHYRLPYKNPYHVKYSTMNIYKRFEREVRYGYDVKKQILLRGGK